MFLFGAATQQCGVLVRSRSESSRADPDEEIFEYAKLLSVLEVPHPPECDCKKDPIILGELEWYKESGVSEGLTLAKKVPRTAGMNPFFFADSIHPTPVVFVKAPNSQSFVFEIV